MKTISRGSTNTVLAVLVALLTAVVAVQSYLIFRSRRPVPIESLRPARQQNHMEETKNLSSPFTGDFFEDWFGHGFEEWHPLVEMRMLSDQIERLFDESLFRFPFHSWPDQDQETRFFRPQVDLTEEGENYVVRMNIPGVDKASVEVTMDDRVLTVTGRVEESFRKEENGRQVRIKRRQGRFERSITLPGPVRSEAMRAEYNNGVLTVRVPKSERTVPAKPLRLI